MFSKKKKGDVKTDAAAQAPAEAPAAAEAATPEPAAPGPGPGIDSSSSSSSSSSEPGGGLLAGGLGGGKAGKPNIAASRLGGRPPAKPSAPSTPSYTAPSPVSAAQAPPPVAPVPSASNSGLNSLAVNAEAEMSKSGRMNAMKEHASSDIVGGVAGGDEKGEGKNPYKLNPLFDVILPVGMALVLCGGFAMGVKIQKDKHAIYGFTKEEQETVVKDKSIASEQIITEVKKMEPLKLLESGETTQALAAAREMGVANLKVANASQDQSEQSKAVRGLLCAGMVLCRAGSKPEKEL
ncbi:MAG: hypothetical protein KGS72_26635, partial [Cyanobacteria bacterium REEB67]|nr:hypothetical protein [Cyanobacteria bacterium REEB67]